MSKKYRYNPDTLSYEQVKQGWLYHIVRTLIYGMPSLAVGIVLATMYIARVDSPSEKRLSREVTFYKQQFERVQEDMKLFNQVLDEISNRERNIYRVALGAPDMPESIRSMGVGGTKRYMELEGFTYSELVKQTRSGIDVLQGKLYAQILSFKEIEKIALEQDERLASIPSIQPVSNKDLKRLASGFGWRVDPVYRTPRMHWGLDFSAPVGTEVYATGDGMVEQIEDIAWGYGKNIVINHGFGYKTRYAHLSAFKVKVGQKISRGQVIGLVGNTGKSTGAHLHYEVEKDGVKVNPISYFFNDLTPEEYDALLQQSSQSTVGDGHAH
jgi:murein DD-endopeptidase MepM/ murein hydrolase activator NlpD